MSRVVAICGKGGVGKTTVSAIMARELMRRQAKALIVDADHAGGLTLSLHMPRRKSINSVRAQTIAEIKSGSSDKRDLAMSVDFLLAEAMVEKSGLAFIAIGRPEEVGCYCSVNSLLRAALESLAGGFEAVVIDAEAGIEQVNRKVMSSVDYLLLVSDGSRKGIVVAEDIARVAEGLTAGAERGLFLNRVNDPAEVETVRAATELPVIGFAPEDEEVRRRDARGESILEMPETPAVRAVAEIMERRLFGQG